MFWTNNYDSVYNAKQEILMQVKQLDIVIVARGFFEVDRKFISAVSPLIVA